MPSFAEKKIVQKMLEQFSLLKQAASDAEEWHKRYQQEIKVEYDNAVVQIETEFNQKTDQLNAQFEKSHSEGVRSVLRAQEALGILAADWASDVWKSYDPALRATSVQKVDSLTGLTMQLGGYGSAAATPGGVRIGVVKETNVKQDVGEAPAIVPFTGKSHILIISEGAAKERALRLLQSIVTRVALTFPVLSARFVFIDPLGLGDNFPFKRLPESIRGNTVYSETDEIRAQMRELTEHLKRVTLRYLAREYDNIEAYNRDAEEIVEPYRFLSIADFPAKFDTDAATRLLSVAEKGVRTGVYLLMHAHMDSGMPRDFDFEALKRMATVIVADPVGFTFPVNGEQFEFSPDDIPDSNLFNTLLDKVDQASQYGVFQGIPFEKIAPNRENWWHGNARNLIEVPVGRTGARDILNFWLGQQQDSRISSHALVGGRAGSGKSTLFHVLINSLALTYSPDELELYLVDFKEGVEFKPYANYQLPHARVIAIESEREFGLSVLRKFQAELGRRGLLFKEANVDGYSLYRERTNSKLPRIVLIIDEFQILFNEQDMLSNKAAQILEDLARRGRAFGIHMILGSQSVQVANLPKGVFGQFATRIALQSPEHDIAALLGPDNVSAAEILERPGEVIYNDDGGRRDRNQPGQVAIIREEALPLILEQLNRFAETKDFRRTEPQIVFQGNQPSDFNDNQQLQQLYNLSEWPDASQVKDMLGEREWIAVEKPSIAWLGEAIEIKPHTAATFRRRSRSNLLIVGEDERFAIGMIGGALISLAAFYKPGDVLFRIIDLSLQEEAWGDICNHFQVHFSFHDIMVSHWDIAAEMIDDMETIVKQRQEMRDAHQRDLGPTVFFIMVGMHRLSTLAPVPAKFGGRDEPSGYANKMLETVRHGPDLGIHTVLWCDSAKTFDGYLGRPQLAHFNRRIALPMTKDDSQLLLSDPIAGTLQAYRAIMLDNERTGTFEKFKPYAFPMDSGEQEQLIKSYGDRLQVRPEGKA